MITMLLTMLVFILLLLMAGNFLLLMGLAEIDLWEKEEKEEKWKRK